MTHRLWALLLLLISFNISAQTKSNPSFDHKHSELTHILKAVIKQKGPQSQVNYASLKKQHTARLKSYLNSLSAISEKDFLQWKQKQQIAFLINAYNAFTLQLIIKHYPIESIKDIGTFFTSPWKLDFFELFQTKRTLDWIEHEVLRKRYSEPRIHFALNCASISCPALKKSAYIGEILDQQLSEQTRLFLQDKKRNYIDKNTLYLSKIFDWFDSDFIKSKGSVESFVAMYITQNIELQKKIVAKNFKIKYLPYNWKLNKAKP